MASITRICAIPPPQASGAVRAEVQQPAVQGFKTSVLGDLVTGFIAAVTVGPGNRGDAAPGHELLRRAKAMELRVDRVLADSAFGGTVDRLIVRSMGIELVAPPQAQPADDPTVVQKHEFAIDFEQVRATCPARNSVGPRAIT